MRIIKFNHESHNILLESEDSILTVNSKDIFVIEKNDEKTFLIMGENERFEIINTESEYAELIRKVGFIQIHHKYAVNPEKIRAFKTKTLVIEIINNQQLPVNVQFKSDLIYSINQLNCR